MDENINYKRIETAIRFILRNYKEQPSLEQVSSELNLSPYHFQRIFTEWAGISPKKFLQYVTIENLKNELKQRINIAEAAENVGLSAQSRVYDLFVNIEAVTPEEFRNSGKNITIEYGFHSTPFGRCLIAITERGICSLDFVSENENTYIESLKNNWEKALVIQNQKSTADFTELIFEPNKQNKLNLYVKGTKFQVKVWEALLKIPFGRVTGYKSVAEFIGKPGATRAVASAIGKNPIAYLIPCHRVIRNEGVIGQYHWGSSRKTAMIGWEKARILIQ